MKINEGTLSEYIRNNPHNLSMSEDYILKLIQEVGVRNRNCRGLSPEETASYCLNRFGGTLAEALVDGIING